MALIKRKDLVEENALQKFRQEVQGLTKDLKKLQEQSRAVNKTGTGAEAQKRIQLTKKLTATTKRLITVTTKQAEAIQKANADRRDQNALNKANATLNNKLAGTEEKLLATNAKLRLQRKKLIETDKGYQKSLQKINNQLDQNNAKMKRNSDQMKKQRLGIGRYAGAMRNVGKQMLTMFGGMTAFFAVVGVIKNALNIFINFSKASSKLASVLGTTKDQIKGLTDQAKELGGTTIFTAQQVIDLQTELAKLGFEQGDIKASTEGILDLAAATGHDLAESATLAGATLRIFNLDATEMGRVADVLAVSTAKSALDMTKLATALPIVGKTADVAGVSLERTVALLGTLTNRGLDASMSATALRNVFLQLSKQGLSWEEAMEKINNSTNKNKTAMKLFGVRASTASIILSQTAESTDDLNKSLTELELTAKKMADIMKDNLAGDITTATSAWQGFVLSVEDGEGSISKSMRSIVQDFTDFLNTLTTFNETNFVNKLKILANTVLALFNRFIPLVDMYNTLTGSSIKFQFEIENTSKSIDEQKKAVGFLNSTLKQQVDFIKQVEKEELSAELAAAELARAEERLIDNAGNLVDGNGKVITSSAGLRAERNKRIKQNEKLIKQQRKIALHSVKLADQEAKEANTSDIDDRLAAEMDAIDKSQAAQDKVVDDMDVARALELDKIQDQEDAILAIKEAAWTAGAQLATDIFSAFQDERLAKINSDAEAQKAILQERLDKGIISEEQFAKQVAAIEQKQRIASAKAEKRKALFDIAIATAVAAIKALPNFIASAAILVIGGIQAAAVIAKPIPKLAKGEVNIEGKSHSQGGIQAEIEGGESVINKAATADSEGILNMVNKGLLTDKNLPEMTKQDNNMLVAGLLMSGNKDIKSLVTLMGNMGWSYDEGGERVVRPADGSLIKRFNV